MDMFVEGVCCGDCAKCQIAERPQTTQGMANCAVANILPKVFCTHDLLVEQNAILAKLLKSKDADIADLKSLAASLLARDSSIVELQKVENTTSDEARGLNPDITTEDKTAKRLSSSTKTK